MIAKVNGTVVSAADVEEETKAILAQHQQQIPQEQLKAMLPKIQKQAVESIINRHLLYEEVDRKKIAYNPERVQAEIDKIAGQFPSQAAFEQQLSNHGISLDKMKEDLGQQFRVDALIRGYVDTKNIRVSDDEVLTFYNSNPESFQSPEQVRASHILLQVANDEPQEVRTQKRLEMAGIIGQIEKGADFAQMAQNHSDCPSKQNGGDLGAFARGQMVKPFEEAAFKMKPGEVSDIVETEFGYHVIKLVEKNEARKEEFADVKDQITNHLISVKEQSEFQELVKELREGATIEYAEQA
ncbi:MAG: peptidylprolyl isomerase [Proteobacteria bacterium]|nr:peptidylprolyl isomerase [Pseudomonadota bacterium]